MQLLCRWRARASVRLHRLLLVVPLALICAGSAVPGGTGDPWTRPAPTVARQPAVPAFDLRELNGARERGAPPASHRPTVQAAFTSESYRPDTLATLRFFDSARRLSLRFYEVGAGADSVGNRPLVKNDVMRGMPIGAEQQIAAVHPGSQVGLRIGNWPSGLYYALVRAPGGRVGYAPFVLAPRRLGEHRIAVVIPTQTWQAYNFRDDNRDGKADTWYADPDHVTTARLYRPFENRGVPRRYKTYNEPFLRWLVHEKIAVDVISDAEL